MVSSFRRNAWHAAGISLVVFLLVGMPVIIGTYSICPLVDVFLFAFIFLSLSILTGLSLTFD